MPDSTPGPSPNPAKPVIHYSLRSLGGRTSYRKEMWKRWRRDLALRLNLMIECPEPDEAIKIGRGLRRIRNQMGVGFLVVLRGNAVFVSHF